MRGDKSRLYGDIMLFTGGFLLRVLGSKDSKNLKYPGENPLFPSVVCFVISFQMSEPVGVV